MDNIPYIAHEAEVARLERTIKRLVVVIIVAISLIFASNVIWLYFWNQYEYVGEEFSVNQDGLGVNIVGAYNEVDNGAEGSD